MTERVQHRKSGSQVPYYAIAYETFKKVAYAVSEYIGAWLKETGGVKTLLIKFPDAIVSISKRIDPATLSGRTINTIADFLTPLHALGGCASTLLGFAEVGSKFPAMFNPFKTQVQYTARGANNDTYRAQFSLPPLERAIDKALSVADWAFSLSGCASYIWKLNHTADETFPLASSLATWSGRCMSLGGLFLEGRFLYETLWVGKPQTYKAVPEKHKPDLKEYHPIEKNVKVAWEEVAGSMLKISLSVVCLSFDLFKKLATKENQSPWLDTAIFCAGLAPTFITPIAMRCWPKMVVAPLYESAASA